MPQMKESWTRIGIVSVIACVLAGLSFGLIRALVLSGAERFIAFIFSVWLIGCVFSFAFDKLSDRAGYRCKNLDGRLCKRLARERRLSLPRRRK